MFKFKLMSSHDSSHIDEYCSFRAYQSGATVGLSVWFTNPNKKEPTTPFSRLLMRDFIAHDEMNLTLDSGKFKINNTDFDNGISVAFSICSIEGMIENKYERCEFLFNLIRDYCESNHYVVGDSEFVRIEDGSGRWMLLCKEPWCDEIDLEELKTQNISLARMKRGKTELFYHKDVGYLKKPQGWEFFESGNACITKRVKAKGAIWTVVEFESRGRHGSVKNVPVTKGYIAPMENVSEAKHYYEKNRLTLLNRKIMRKLKGETSLSKREKKSSSLGKISLTDEQVELFRKIVKDNKNKL